MVTRTGTKVIIMVLITGIGATGISVMMVTTTINQGIIKKGTGTTTTTITITEFQISLVEWIKDLKDKLNRDTKRLMLRIDVYPT